MSIPTMSPRRGAPPPPLPVMAGPFDGVLSTVPPSESNLRSPGLVFATKRRSRKVGGREAGSPRAGVPEGELGQAIRVVQSMHVTSDVRCMEIVGHTVWLGCRDGGVSIRCARSGEVLGTVPGTPAAGVWCLRLVQSDPPALPHGNAPSPSGVVWAGLATGTIVLIDPHTRQPVSHLRRHAGGVHDIVSAQGHVWTAGNDFSIFEWTSSGDFVRLYSGHHSGVRCLLMCGHVLVSGGEDAAVRLWDTAAGTCLHTLRHHSAPVHCLARVGGEVWSAGVDGIRVWSLNSLCLLGRMQHPEGPVLSMARVGMRVYTGGADRSVCAWDARARQLVGVMNEHAGWVGAIRATAQVVRYYAWSAASHDGLLRVWHHDEYHALDPLTKECYEEGADLTIAAGGAHVHAAAALRDNIHVLRTKCRALAGEAAGQAERAGLLEDELGEHHRCLAEQLGMRRATAEVLRSVEQERLPALEAALASREQELANKTKEIQERNTLVAELRREIAERDARISGLERSVAVANSERDDARRQHDAHKRAHLRFIETDVDGVIAECNRKQEQLQDECRRLREQLVHALDLNAVLRGSAPTGATAQTAEVEGARALAMGPPGGPTPGRPAHLPWRDSSLGDYIRARYYSGDLGPAPVTAPPRPPASPPRRATATPPPPAPPSAPRGRLNSPPRPPRPPQRRSPQQRRRPSSARRPPHPRHR